MKKYMRRNIIFIFIFSLVCSFVLFLRIKGTNIKALLSEGTNITSHKHCLIELVNSGEFDEAVKELSLVEEWTLNVKNKGDYIDVEKTLHFGSLLDSIQNVKANRDSFLLYLNEQVTIYSYYFYNNGNYSEAEKYILESLRICKEVLGENHHFYAFCLDNLGGLYKTQGNYSVAEQYYLESLCILKEVLGENNPKYATSLRNLGLLYEIQGNYSAAEKIFIPIC